jgi:S1-C subfamily serine protease
VKWLLEITEDVPTFADGVRVIGYPGRAPLRISAGKVDSAGRLSPECRTFQISAPVAPGSSGSPVLNDAGKVIGIAKAMKLYPVGLPETYATPISRLQDMATEETPLLNGTLTAKN